MPPIQLPAHSGEPQGSHDASRRRAEIAERLAQSCPPALADEIALVGSTARGFADDDSDLELNLWASAIPPLGERLDWLQAAGASEIHAELAPRPDDSYWLKFRLDAIPGEVGWQTFDAIGERLDLIRSGVVSDRKTLAFADIIASAIPLRTAGGLQRWQQTLADYPDAVQRAIIAAAVERWQPPDSLAAAHRLARHGEQIALMELLLDDLDAAIRILYAANRRWEPSRKWTLTVAREFAPQDLPARIDAVLGDPSLERRVELCARLCLDALALVPEQIDVSAAVAGLKAGLSE